MGEVSDGPVWVDAAVGLSRQVGSTFRGLVPDTHPSDPAHVPTKSSPFSSWGLSPGNMDPAACRVEELVSAIRVSLPPLL